MSYLNLVASVVVFALVVVVARSRLRAASRGPLPPGPRGEPILGHLRVIPADNPERAYQKWSEEYNSDVLYFKVLQQDVIVLNSVQAAVDLLDKRGANYCDRPTFTLFETMGWKATLTFLRWGPRFQMHRKLLQSYFTKPQIVAFRELQTSEARVLVKNLIQMPLEFDRLLRRFATSIVMAIAFGHRIHSDDDPYIQIGTDASYAVGHAGAPAATPVDFFPLLRHLPDWLPRPTSLKFARNWRWAIERLYDVPFAAIQKEMREGTAQSSFILPLLEEISSSKERGTKPSINTADVKGAAGAIYIAGQDTTWSTLVIFLLNMVLNPEVQRKAQAELDAVVGSDRLPEFSDRESLPYLENLLQETFRWYPVSPLGVPHKSLEDDIYKGMFIPKGSVVFANALSMCHDEKTYQDSWTFNPDRFAPRSAGGNEEPYPSGHFGFGRRVCVGRHLAEASLWIAIATILATLTIGKEVGPDGKELTPEVAFSAGLTSHPEVFKCTIRPRSFQAADMVKNAAT